MNHRRKRAKHKREYLMKAGISIVKKGLKAKAKKNKKIAEKKRELLYNKKDGASSELEPKVYIGTFDKSENFGFVRCADRKYPYDIFIPIEKSMDARDGEMVKFEITTPASNRKKPEGIIVETLGFPEEEAGNDVLYIAKAYDLPMEWSDKIKLQVERVAKPVSQADIDFRMDLRDVKMVTIDGEDAKDLDDAVSLSFDEDKKLYTLGVHIADVSNYVQEGSALDKEALERGTSVYLVDRVIPMLPVELSNGICSLNAGEERLALSCIMKITEDGDIIDHEIAETVIRVDERMTYTAVNSIIEKDEKLPIYKERYGDLVEMFDMMAHLSQILRDKRHERGAVDFDFPESKVLLDENGAPKEIVLHEANRATRLIEDFMLAANETVAEDFCRKGIPFLYRIHEEPTEEKLTLLKNVLSKYGYYIDERHHEPKDYQKLTEKIKGTEEEGLLLRLVLRSMSQAKYSPESLGHFGLAAKYYCHFTSPIRRYPDLQIHRIIREYLHGRLDEKRIDHYKRLLGKVGLLTSD
ncbi:MAG: VacB/RNase II family 3'-5' exoribonuclease, partial [Eubacterium sp.]|nr:VacB/RNase II family 3'-5' exoribonuclease [Eubacterium sp.]